MQHSPPQSFFFLHIVLLPLVCSITSYVKDSVDFLKQLPQTVRFDATFCTFDVVNLYGSIPHELGIEAISYWINRSKHLLPSRIDHDFIVEGIKLILENSIFQFNGSYYRQIKGTAMGTKVAPTYAILTLGFLEESILYPTVNKNLGNSALLYFKRNFFRYIDDCFILWPKLFPHPGTLLNLLNAMHPAIKFSAQYDSNAMPFLDILLIRHGNLLITDLYRKPTDSMNYLHFKSNHPSHTKRNIPFNVARRISTIVTNAELRELRLKELKHVFCKLQYPKLLVEEAIKRASAMDIEELRKQRTLTSHDNRLCFVTTYNPNNPDIFPIIRECLQTLSLCSSTKDIFQDKQLVKSNKQANNLKRLLTKAKLTPNAGYVSQCGDKRCACCKHLIIGDKFHFSTTNTDFFIKNSFCCNSRNLIYVLVCNSCSKFYIGQTSDTLRNRCRVHRQHINNPSSAPLKVSRHIAECCKHDDIKFSIMPLLSVNTDRNILFIERNFIA